MQLSTAGATLAKGPEKSSIIFGCEVFAVLSAATALGGQLRRRRTTLFIDNNVSAEAPVGASSREPIVPCISEFFL